MTKPIVISTDSHIAGGHVDFSEYFDPDFRPVYEEQRAIARRAAAVLAKRRNAEPKEGTGTASAGLLDQNAKGDSPFEPHLILERQNVRHELVAGLGVEEWDDDEFMTVPREQLPEWRLKYMELDGVAASVIFPQLGFILGSVSDPAAVWAGIRAHNRWMAEFCSVDPERWAGVFMVDLSDIERACEEARWAKENGLRGGSYIMGGRQPGLPTFNQLYYEPYFKVLEELDLPFNMHAAFNLTGDSGWRTGPGAAFLNEMWTSNDPLAKGGPLMYWLAGGVFERHPRLKVVVAETGGAYWAAAACRILDEVYEQPARSAMRVLNRARVDGIREFPRKPSEYFASNVWVQGHTETLDWENLFAVGIDNVMWGSDFPHAEGSWPDSRDWIQKRQSEFKLARADLDKYLSVNAAKVYGFDLDVLRPIGERIGPDIAG